MSINYNEISRVSSMRKRELIAGMGISDNDSIDDSIDYLKKLA